MGTPLLGDLEARARLNWAALPPTTRARWGTPYFEQGMRGMRTIITRAQSPLLAVNAMADAVEDVAPWARYRAGTGAKLLLPLLSLLPAWLSDAAVAAGMRVGMAEVPAASLPLSPLGVEGGKKGVAVNGVNGSSPKPARRRRGASEGRGAK